MAADMADTRSSSTSFGRAEAMIRPSTDTTADDSISGETARIWRNLVTICSVFVKAISSLLSMGEDKITIHEFTIILSKQKADSWVNKKI
jgi:hypothetical protein